MCPKYDGSTRREWRPPATDESLNNDADAEDPKSEENLFHGEKLAGDDSEADGMMPKENQSRSRSEPLVFEGTDRRGRRRAIGVPVAIAFAIAFGGTPYAS
ncbi:hypothetical protein KFK09_027358 [Dendrobium nobile]|uniref:Uncharacterized protein n=1 Tax=Dendrobium nobile TaxID=94219 RepID=A0A8T3ABC7_DENNO|nr:hypothetical protein KFK09_027358 [Dendrobium nobile]